MKNVCKRLKALKGYSIAEVTVVLIIMAGILLLVGRIVLGDRQKEYDAKFNKISSLISANISKDLVENTGAEYKDYASVVSPTTDNDGNKWFKNAILNNVDVKGDASTPVASKTCTDCWGANEVTIDDKTYNEFSDTGKWSMYELNDNTVIAISGNDNTFTEGDKTYYNTDILVDVNGKKGPNVPGKDIHAYNYPNITCKHLSPMPNDGIYTYETNDKICDWVKSGCISTSLVLS